MGCTRICLVIISVSGACLLYGMSAPITIKQRQNSSLWTSFQARVKSNDKHEVYYGAEQNRRPDAGSHGTGHGTGYDTRKNNGHIPESSIRQSKYKISSASKMTLTLELHDEKETSDKNTAYENVLFGYLQAEGLIICLALMAMIIGFVLSELLHMR